MSSHDINHIGVHHGAAVSRAKHRPLTLPVAHFADSIRFSAAASVLSRNASASCPSASASIFAASRFSSSLALPASSSSQSAALTLPSRFRLVSPSPRRYGAAPHQPHTSDTVLALPAATSASGRKTDT